MTETWSSEFCPFLTKKPIVNNWYRVKKSDIPAEILQIHKNNLTIRSTVLNFVTNEPEHPNLCYEDDEESDEFRVPFYYGMKSFGTDFVDERNVGLLNSDHVLSFKGTLDETNMKQVSATNAILQSMDTIYGTGLLALDPGMGKTVAACYIWVEMCKRQGAIIPLLVLVHKEHLITQWIERLQKYVSDVKIGKMQGKIMEYEDRDVVLCTIQSLITSVKDDKGNLQPRYAQDVMKRFGFLIIDEAHRKFFSTNSVIY